VLMAVYAAALLEELESLVEQLDQQEASKKQALDRAEAAERDLEALKLEQSSLVWFGFVVPIFTYGFKSH